MNTIKRLRKDSKIKQEGVSNDETESRDQYKSSKEYVESDSDQTDKSTLETELNSDPQITNMFGERNKSEEESVELYVVDDEEEEINNPDNFNLKGIKVYDNKTFNYSVEENDGEDNTIESTSKEENGTLIYDKGNMLLIRTMSTDGELKTYSHTFKTNVNYFV